MANNTARVPLDNFVQSGDTTLGELLDAVAAVNGGTRPGVADVVRDTATGKLIRVDLTFPDTVATAAINAINANAGVPTTIVAIPLPLVITDLAVADGLAWSGAALKTDERILVLLPESLFTAFVLGGIFEGTTYTDKNSTLSAAGMILDFRTKNSTGDFTINSGDLTVKSAAGQTVPIVLNNPLVVPAVPVGGFPNFDAVWVDSGGKLYKQQTGRQLVLSPALSFADAVALGAL